MIFGLIQQIYTCSKTSNRNIRNTKLIYWNKINIIDVVLVSLLLTFETFPSVSIADLE